MTEKLISCPFCKSNKINITFSILGHRAICGDCEAMGPAAESDAEAAAAWNKRVTPKGWWETNEPINNFVYLGESYVKQSKLDDAETLLTQATNANIEQRREIERLRKQLAENNLPAMWVSNYSLPGTPSLDEVQARSMTNDINERNAKFVAEELRALVEELAKENTRLREAIRKARKVLTILDKNFHQDEATEARRILKSALKGEG
jgi:Lar family restriction alleviation protein